MLLFVVNLSQSRYFKLCFNVSCYRLVLISCLKKKRERERKKKNDLKTMYTLCEVQSKKVELDLLRPVSKNLNTEIKK